MPEPTGTVLPASLVVAMATINTAGLDITAGAIGAFGGLVSLYYMPRKNPLTVGPMTIIILAACFIAAIGTKPMHHFLNGSFGVTESSPIDALIAFMLGLISEKLIPWILNTVPWLLGLVRMFFEVLIGGKSIQQTKGPKND